MNPLLPLRIAISLLLIAISSSLLALIGSSLSWKAKHKHEFATFSSRNGTETVKLAIFPLYTQIGSYAILIAAGCGGLVDQLLYMLFKLARRDIFGSKMPNSIITKGLIALRLCISGAALIFSFIQYYGSSTFAIGLAPAQGIFGAGHFTMEAWTCQTETQIEDRYTGSFGRMCKEGKAARWLLIPYFLLIILLLCLEFWVGREKNVRSQRGKPQVEGSHRIESKV